MTALLTIQENISLGAMNTLGLEALAHYFVTIDSAEQLPLAWEFARERGLPMIPLGGGSNVVLTKDLEALVLKIQTMERIVLQRDDSRVLVRAGAGELWHEFVLWTLSIGGYGLENLSLIPGTVGAAPIQNIGAYGVELKDHFVSLTAFDVTTGCVVDLDAEQCAFGYRDSRFKHDWRDPVSYTHLTLPTICSV